MMKKFFGILLALAMVLSLAACGGKDAPASSDGGGQSTGGAASGAFKIGGTGPLTGGASIYGIAVRNGAQIAVDEINAMGGIQFELKYEDDTHDAEKAVNAYNALKSWGMQLSLSSVTSTPAEATSPMNFEDRIFGLTPSASSVATTQGKDNVFQMCFIDPAQGTMAAHSIADNNLGSKIAVIWKNDDVYSAGIYETFMAEAASVGLEIVSDTNFNDATSTDFSVQINDAQSKGADLVFLPMYYQPASQILAQAAAVGFAPRWFGVDGMDGILTMEGFDPAMAEGVMLQTPFNASSEDAATQAFVAEYQSRFGEVPNQFAANAYDCIYAYKQALENAGATPDMSAEELCVLMIEQFTSMTFDGITGTGATWSTEGAVSKTPTVVVIENGAYVGLN